MRPLTETELKNRSRAQKRGYADASKSPPQPSPTETEFSECEMEIVSLVNGRIGERERAAIKEIEKLRKPLDQAQQEVDGSRAFEIGVQSEVDVDRAIEDSKSEVMSAYRSYLEAARDYRSFRALHALTESPAYARDLRLKWLIVFIAFAVEVALNVVFFQGEVPGGWKGAFAVAMVIPFINVGGGYLFGISAIRYAIHRNILARLLSYVAIPVVAILVGMTELTIGTFRDLFVASAGQATIDEAITRVLNNPPGPQSLQGFGLAFLSLVIFVYCAYNGATSNGLYPGYAKRHRRMNEAFEDFRDAKAEVKEAILEGLRGSREAVEKESRRIRVNRTRIRKAMGDIVRAGEALERDAGMMRQTGANVIGLYRSANRHVRGEVPPPPYFELEPEFRESGIQAEVDVMRETEQAALMQVEEVAAKLAEASELITVREKAAFERVTAEFPEVESDVEDAFRAEEDEIARRSTARPAP